MLVLITYALVAPHPLWVFGASGESAETYVDTTLTGFLQHVIAYSVLAWATILAFGAENRRAALWCVVALAVHGLLMEGIQLFVPHRYCDLPDALANFVGAGTGWLFACATLPFVRSSERLDTGKAG